MVEELESKTAHLEVAQAFRKRIGPPAAGDNSTTVEVPEALLRRAVYVLENTRRPISVEAVREAATRLRWERLNRRGKAGSFDPETPPSETEIDDTKAVAHALGIEVEDGDA